MKVFVLYRPTDEQVHQVQEFGYYNEGDNDGFTHWVSYLPPHTSPRMWNTVYVTMNNIT